jgi:iron complex transport system ATP-binding protein
MKSALLSFHQVEFGYDPKRAPLFKGLQFSLEEGSVTTILGPNGAGKSTVLLLAMGWLKSWQGRVCLSGKPIQEFSRLALGREMAFIPQAEHIPFEYTTLEYVLLGRTPFLPPLGMPGKEDLDKAYAALEQVGAAYLFDHPILAISGGERQLVVLARALAQQPRILLMDEPSAHLDLANKFRLAQVIRSLREKDCTILLTTHEPDFALAASDNAILMKKGRVLYSGLMAGAATNQHFSSLYDIQVKVKQVDGKPQVIWH